MVRVIIADDSEAIRQLLRDILTMGDHQVVGEAVDGNEAIDTFNKIQPDLLLLDLSMPKKDGLTVVKQILEYHSDAKIILISASGNEKIIQDCLDAGAMSFISKPFEYDNVQKIISEVIKK